MKPNGDGMHGSMMHAKVAQSKGALKLGMGCLVAGGEDEARTIPQDEGDGKQRRAAGQDAQLAQRGVRSRDVHRPPHQRHHKHAVGHLQWLRMLPPQHHDRGDGTAQQQQWHDGLRALGGRREDVVEVQ